MGSLARRLAPAAALGGLAVVIVGLLDPAIAAKQQADAAPVTDANTSGASTAQGSAQADQQPQSATASDTATCANGDSVNGPTVTTRWGPVQVAGTVSNGKLCEVHAVAWPDGDHKSAQISAYAIPQLDAQAAQQGVQLDGISGATYTTEGYRQSLQGLLDSL